MGTSIYTIRVQGADGRIVPASFRASSLTAAESMALARGYDVIVTEDDEDGQAAGAGADGAPADQGAAGDPVAPELDGSTDDAALFIASGPHPISGGARQAEPGEEGMEEDPGDGPDAEAGAADEADADGEPGAEEAADEADADGGSGEEPDVPWAYWAWLSPFVIMACAAGLWLLLPDLRAIVRLGAIGLLAVAVVVGVAAIVAARARGAPILHGALGLATVLPLLAALAAGWLLAPAAAPRDADGAAAIIRTLLSEELAAVPYASGGGTVSACAVEADALVRNVDMPGTAPAGGTLRDAAATHRAALLGDLPQARPQLVARLVEARIRLVDRLRWESAADPVVEVALEPDVWVAVAR